MKALQKKNEEMEADLKTLQARFVAGTSGDVMEQSTAITAQITALEELREELRANLMQCNTVRAPHTTPHHTTLEQPFAHPQARVSPLALALARPNYVSRRNAAR